ncbi:MAG: hypothetical protein ABMA64_28105 [Myxococcota bacterium]
MIPWLLGCTAEAPPMDGDTDTSSLVAPPGDPYAVLPIGPQFPWTDADVAGRRFSYHVPDDPIGLVFAFHGSHGGFDTVTQVEWLDLYNLLVPAGVAVVLSESLQREDPRQWDLSSSSDNPDFAQLAAIRDWLIEQTAVGSDTPIASVGFSNGGSFANVFSFVALGAGWDVRTFVAHNASQYDLSVPAMFVSAENDEEVRAPDEAVADCAGWTSTECPHLVGTEILLDPRRFARLPQYTVDDSAMLFDELVDLGMIDPSGARLVDIDDPDAVMDWYVANSEGPSPTLPPNQLRVVWATHRLSSQHAYEEATWLVERLTQ